jgi:serine/threonine protein phosphatase PrpC
MEDTIIHYENFKNVNHYLFGVFDGHGGKLFFIKGPEVAIFVKKHFFKELIKN